MNKLILIKSEPFRSVKCDFWKDSEGNVLMTREQIGQALEYSDPMVAIGKIHDRHDERLNKFSFTNLVNGRNTYLYTRKGIMEICRWSQQPKADAFMDWVWDVVETINKHGVYATEELLNNPDLAIKAFTALKEEREHNKILLSQNNILCAENKLLSQQTLTWTSRKVLEAIVKAYGAWIKESNPDLNGFHEAWREFKKELLYAHGINLNSRVSLYMVNSGKKTKPKTLSMIHDDELPECISTAVSMCKSNNVNISHIIEKYSKSA